MLIHRFHKKRLFFIFNSTLRIIYVGKKRIKKLSGEKPELSAPLKPTECPSSIRSLDGILVVSVQEVENKSNHV